MTVNRLNQWMLAGLLGLCSLSALADEKVMLNFSNADVESTIRAVGLIANKNFVIDPRVKGNINIVSSSPVNKRDVYPILLSALRLQGFSAIEQNGLIKIVPEADAKLHAAPLTRKGDKIKGDRIITQVYPLQHESASQLVGILRPLIAPNNMVSAYPNSNTLVITDYADNIERLDRIIAAIDQPQDHLWQTVPLKNGSAVDMAQIIARLLPDVSATSSSSSAMPSGVMNTTSTDGVRKSVILPDLRTNSLIIRAASQAQLQQILKLVGRLDVPIDGAGNIRVVYLKNAEAAKLVQTLRAVMTGQGGDSSSTTSASAAASPMGATTSSSSAGGGSVSAGGAIIQADPATNSLIINAPEPVYNNIRAIIEKLDVRRAQVYVEAMIAEVNANVSGEFGIQWLLGGEGSSLSGGVVSSLAPGNNNIVNVATSLASNTIPALSGFQLGLLNGRVSGDGKTANLGMLASAIAGNGMGNILSTPNILTLDNEEAKIIVGQNVPFVTGTQSSTGSNPNPFTTVERKDIGISLKIKPQISEGGAITLQVYQEVSSVDKTVDTGNAGLATSKRSIESKVLIDDGQIVVLGGLIEDRISTTKNKVPFLGDLPLLGSLFRYETRSHNKVNLMVFLRPRVLRDGPAAEALSSERYDLLRKLEGEAAVPASALLPEIPAIQLPQRPAAAPIAAPAPATDKAPS